MGQKELNLVLITKLPSYELALIVEKGAVWAARGTSHQQSYPAVNPVDFSNDWHGEIYP